MTATKRTSKSTRSKSVSSASSSNSPSMAQQHGHRHQKPSQSEMRNLENRERAFKAASRRKDRSMKDRVESAFKASEVHFQRTGKYLDISEEAVLRDGLEYEEVIPDRAERDLLRRLSVSSKHAYCAARGVSVEQFRAAAEMELEQRTAKEQALHAEFDRVYGSNPLYISHQHNNQLHAALQPRAASISGPVPSAAAVYAGMGFVSHPTAAIPPAPGSTAAAAAAPRGQSAGAPLFSDADVTMGGGMPKLVTSWEDAWQLGLTASPTSAAYDTGSPSLWSSHHDDAFHNPPSPPDTAYSAFDDMASSADLMAMEHHHHTAFLSPSAAAAAAAASGPNHLPSPLSSSSSSDDAATTTSEGGTVSPRSLMYSYPTTVDPEPTVEPVDLWLSLP